MENEIFNQIYNIVRQIPKGKVCTYGIIASLLGSKKSARLVGYALNVSHKILPKVPAHRVVNRNGLLTGKHHFKAIDEMQVLLEKEGIVIINDQVQDFDSVIWNPILD